MAELLQAQQTDPGAVPDSFRLRLDAGEIGEEHPEGSLPGHAAWLDWPWKLHRIENEEGEVALELYDLANDSEEANNLLSDHGDRVASMTAELEAWQRSVVASLNGQDYR
jgi:hypothetical protein